MRSPIRVWGGAAFLDLNGALCLCCPAGVTLSVDFYLVSQ